MTTPEKTEGIQSSSQKGVLQKFTVQFKLCKHEKKYQPVCGWERRGSGGSSEDFGEGGIDPLQREGESFKIKLPHLHL